MALELSALAKTQLRMLRSKPSTGVATRANLYLRAHFLLKLC